MGINIFHIMNKESLLTHKVGMYGASTVKRGTQLIYPIFKNE